MNKGIHLSMLQAVFFIGIFFSCTDGDEEQLQVDFSVDTKMVYEAQGVNFELSNPEIVTEASWFFEGGEPEYFNDINPPTIYYGKEGIYSVTLNVIANGQKQIINKENLIHVLVEPEGEFSFTSIQTNMEEIYAGESVEIWVTAFGDNLQYEWSANTGTITGEGSTVTFKTGYCFHGIAEVSARVSNEYGSMERTVKIKVIRKDFNP
jgi:PKD repeat protein